MLRGDRLSFFDEIEREIERVRRRILREVNKFLLEHYGYVERDWDEKGNLRPLYTIHEYPDKYVIIFDLANADTSTLEVKVVGQRLLIEANMEKSIQLSDIYGDVIGKELSISKYRHEINLPPLADPSRMKVKVGRRKIVEVIIPKKL